MVLEKSSLHLIKPHQLFLATLVAVFASEVVVMLILDLLPELPPAGEAFLDACLLSLLVVPFLYFLFLKPFRLNVAMRLQTESEHQRIQAFDRMKSDFISIAAHEFRTPLATIMGYSELLLDDQPFDQAQRREFARVINQKSETLDRLIDDLLDLNRIELGQPLRINKEQNDIVTTLATQVDELRARFPRRQIILELPSAPVVFPFDKVRIVQLVDNLLSNAFKFSPQDAPINLEGFLCERHFQIAIRDRGIGMTPEQLDKIFDKFYRADTSDTSPSGLGLGMAIAKEIVTLHGGRIWFESSPHAGTTAYVALPIDLPC